MFGGIAKKLAVPVFSFLTLMGCSSSNYVSENNSDRDKLVSLVEKHGFEANTGDVNYTYLAFPVGDMRMEIGVFGDKDSLIINERNLNTRISDTKFKDEHIDGLGKGDFIKVFDRSSLKYTEIYPNSSLSEEQKNTAYDVVVKSALERVVFFYEQNFFERIRMEMMIEKIVDDDNSDYKSGPSTGNVYSSNKPLDSENLIKLVYVDNAPFFYEKENGFLKEDEFKIIYYRKNKNNGKLYPVKIFFDKGLDSFGDGDFIAELEGENVTRSFPYSVAEHRSFREEAWKIMEDAEHSLGLK